VVNPSAPELGNRTVALHIEARMPAKAQQMEKQLQNEIMDIRANSDPVAPANADPASLRGGASVQPPLSTSTETVLSHKSSSSAGSEASRLPSQESSLEIRGAAMRRALEKKDAQHAVEGMMSKRLKDQVF